MTTITFNNLLKVLEEQLKAFNEFTIVEIGRFSIHTARLSCDPEGAKLVVKVDSYGDIDTVEFIDNRDWENDKIITSDCDISNQVLLRQSEKTIITKIQQNMIDSLKSHLRLLLRSKIVASDMVLDIYLKTIRDEFALYNR